MPPTTLGWGLRGLKVRRSATDEGGLEVAGDTEALDAYSIALGQAGIALRSLERRTRSLESLFLELTGDRQGIAPVGIRCCRRSRRTAVTEPRMSVGGVFAVVGVECSKLAAQVKAQVLLAICVVAPFAFAIVDARAEQSADRYVVRPRRQ